MKKIYIAPETLSVRVKTEQLLNSVSGDGLKVTISNSNASGEAESRGGSWDDED